MVYKLKDKLPFLFVCCLLAILSCTSTWIKPVVTIPGIILQVITLCLYLLFAVPIIVKLVSDIKNLKSAAKNWINVVYYLFAVYYFGITVYRFLNGMEVKENLYFAIIFFGGVALYSLFQAGLLNISGQAMEANIRWIAILLILYRFMHCTVGKMLFEHQLINVNITTGATAMLLPVLWVSCIREGLSIRQKILTTLAFCGGIVVVLTTGSRAAFLLMTVNLCITFLVNLRNGKNLLRFVALLVMASVVVVSLAVADIGDVRYSLYREMVINSSSKPMDDQDNQMDPDLPIEEEIEQDTQQFEGSEEKEQALAQSSNSDRMRQDLIHMGLKQIKLNPWIGTGDVLYNYQISETYAAVQSSHNFLIEVLCCFGVIGLGFIAVLFCLILFESKLFEKLMPRAWNTKVAMLQVRGFYLAFGFVQPTVFEPVICALFVLAIATCRAGLQELKDAKEGNKN